MARLQRARQNPHGQQLQRVPNHPLARVAERHPLLWQSNLHSPI
jgi:hypothetical protein